MRWRSVTTFFVVMEDVSKACALTQLKQAVTEPVLYEKGVRSYPILQLSL